MSEEQPEKPETPEKPEKPKKAPKADKSADKPEKGKKADKGDKDKGDKDKGGKEKGGKKEKAEPEVIPVPRLQERYEKEVLPALAKHFDRANRHNLPRLQKIVVNMGVGAAVTDKKFLEEAVEAMKTIVGQKPIVTRSRKSIAGFHLREGMPIGCMVTLRGKRMYEFLDRLVSLALPRVRDFRGLSPTAFDGHGNYSLGLTEQLVFPELNPDKFTRTQGMNVTMVTSSDSDDEARELLRRMGLPMRAA
jgi:large subunit ribosomal protein L5